ncbi:protein kinase domain-containing protein [Saprospira grandis]|uniref:protein kinase domain-containing protein n=1 Tax=Saprospira grandis TaxID=1008 RepID=UPI0002EF9A6B|nr:serine/threonine protein kinase [Saprospira grandis]
MSRASYYLEKTKKRIILAHKPFARGGEGALYKVRSPRRLQDRVVKLYYPHKLQAEKRSKLRALANYPPQGLGEEQSPIFVWPEEIVVDQHKQLQGFMMPFVQGHKLELFCLPKLPSRLGSYFQKYNLSAENGRVLRLRLAFELSLGLARLQAEGRYVLVDLKPENILLTADNQLAFVDLDAMQLEHPQGLEKATVTTPEYSAPEYYWDGRPAVFDSSWDNFALAVIIYKLLFGIHPFAAAAGGKYAELTSLHQKIEAGLFPHQSEIPFSVIPPPHQLFKEESAALQEAFKQAFILGHSSPKDRPSARAWCSILWTELGDPNLLGRFLDFYPIVWRKNGELLTVEELATNFEEEEKSIAALEAPILAHWEQQALELPQELPSSVIIPTHLRKEILWALPILVVVAAFLALNLKWAYGFQKSFLLFPISIVLALLGYFKRKKLLLQEQKRVAIGAIWAEIKAWNEESAQPPLAKKELAYWNLEEKKKDLIKEYQQALRQLEKERKILAAAEKQIDPEEEEKALKALHRQKRLPSPHHIWKKKDAFLNQLWEQSPYPLKGQKSIAAAKQHLAALEAEELEKIEQTSFSTDKKDARLAILEKNYQENMALWESQQRSLDSSWQQEELEGKQRLNRLADFDRNYRKRLPSISPAFNQTLLIYMGIDSMLSLVQVDPISAELEFVGGEKRSLAAWVEQKPNLMKELYDWWQEVMAEQKAFLSQQDRLNIDRAKKDLAKERKQWQKKYEKKKAQLAEADEEFFRQEARAVTALKYKSWRKELQKVEKLLYKKAQKNTGGEALANWKKAFLSLSIQHHQDIWQLSAQQEALFSPFSFEERMNFEQKDRQKVLEERLAAYYREYGHEKAPKKGAI